MILDDEEILVEQLSDINAFDILYENFDNAHIVHDLLEMIGFLYENPLIIQHLTKNYIKIQRANKDILFLILRFPDTRRIQVHIYSTALMNHYVTSCLCPKLVHQYKLTDYKTGTLNYNYIK